jgi:hypothetical protein
MAVRKRGPRSPSPAKPVPTAGQILRAFANRPLMRPWEEKDSAHLIRLIKKYGRGEVIAAAMKLPLDHLATVRWFSSFRKDLDLLLRYQELLIQYKDKRNPAYNAACDLFERVEGRKPKSGEEVSRFRDALKKQFRRFRSRRAPSNSRRGSASAQRGNLLGEKSSRV